MEMRFLNNIPKDEAMAVLAGSVAQLQRDYDLNIKGGLFWQVFGRDLSLEEFLVMMIIEKDVEFRRVTGTLPRVQ